MVSSVHSADDVRIVEKEARGLPGQGYHTVPGRIRAKLEPRRIFAKLKIFSQRANA
jgi:hypothetical protein